MQNYVTFDMSKPLDFIPIGRVAIDFNPTDMYMPLSESSNFNKYVGGSPANIAVGLARLGCKVGFQGCVSNDQFGDFVVNYFDKEGIDTSKITRAKNGECLGLTFTEILSKESSSILMYRDNVADFCMAPEDIHEDYIASAKAIVISGTALAQSPSREACLKAMMLAKKNNTRIIFDIDYREYTWKSKDEIAVYYSLVAQNADVIMGSREEFDLQRVLSALSPPTRSRQNIGSHSAPQSALSNTARKAQPPIQTTASSTQSSRSRLLSSKASAAATDTAHHSFTASSKARILSTVSSLARRLPQFLFRLTHAPTQCRRRLRLRSLSKRAKRNTAKWSQEHNFKYFKK